MPCLPAIGPGMYLFVLHEGEGRCDRFANESGDDRPHHASPRRAEPYRMPINGVSSLLVFSLNQAGDSGAQSLRGTPCPMRIAVGLTGLVHPCSAVVGVRVP